MKEFFEWHNDTRGEKAVEALKKNHFKAFYCKERKEALEKILNEIPAGSVIGAGGSWTVAELGVLKELEARGHTILNHGKPGLSPEEKMDIRRKQLTSDVFITGTNAVTMDGQLVNVDGTGNRVAAMIFGPGKVIVVTGVNKVVKNVDEGLERIRQTAAPINNKRLGTTNPCTLTGECMDCMGPGRICNATVILNKKPTMTDIHVFIIGEDLGF
ncbi:MAG TPA: lactate utilization protein C [Synergistaceae bacterium]|jgi:L-lactate utilization protein LutB|nr:lactate utilization protein C [Synergistaceae bacterium]HCP07795.1 lactate utilization protein C [Synergistaceae bacterium]HCR38181.1 lactate utilization protein C [Synergistaceae bacterium]